MTFENGDNRGICWALLWKKHAVGFAGGFWKVEPQKHNCKKAEKTWRE
jgi:hypothetical protein